MLIIDGHLSQEISLRRDIDVDKWDAPFGRAKATRDDGRAFNLYLAQVRAELADRFSELKYQYLFRQVKTGLMPHNNPQPFRRRK